MKKYKVIKTTFPIMGRPRQKIIFRGSKEKAEVRVQICNQAEKELCDVDKLHALIPSSYRVV